MPIVTPVPIPTAPEAPQRNDPATFEERNDAAVEYQFETIPVAINQQSEAAYQNALAAKGAANAAADEAEAARLSAIDATNNGAYQVELAEGHAQSAAADRVQTGLDRVETGEDRLQTGLDRGATGLDAIATAADRVQTGLDRAAVADGLASIADGPVFRVGGQTGDVALKTLNGSALTGAGDIVIDSSLYRVERASNTQLVAADKGKLIDITSGTFMQTFAAADALVDGWFCYIKNSGSGDITIPSSDGRTNWIMYSGEMRLFQCDGTSLRSIVLSAFYKVFTTSGQFIKPPGYMAFDGLLWAGGGGGASGNFSYLVAGGGGGSSCLPFSILSTLLLGVSTLVVIGAGATSASGAPGGQGGESGFGIFSAFGALGGQLGESGSTNGGGKSPVSDFPATVRYDGAPGGGVSSFGGVAGAAAKYGGAGGGGGGNSVVVK